MWIPNRMGKYLKMFTKFHLNHFIWKMQRHQCAFFFSVSLFFPSLSLSISRALSEPFPFEILFVHRPLKAFSKWLQSYIFHIVSKSSSIQILKYVITIIMNFLSNLNMRIHDRLSAFVCIAESVPSTPITYINEMKKRRKTLKKFCLNILFSGRWVYMLEPYWYTYTIHINK